MLDSKVTQSTPVTSVSITDEPQALAPALDFTQVREEEDKVEEAPGGLGDSWLLLDGRHFGGCLAALGGPLL